MIAALRGELVEITSDSCLIMTGGVGYEVHCSMQTAAELLLQKNKEIFIHIYTHVREDALQLFGFLSSAEKTLFLSLLKVNGIGPKSAMHILSGASVSQIAEMIEQEDVKALSKLPKVGKKTAEQMILELKGKLVLAVDSNSAKKPVGVTSQISSALINLGFRSQDVEKVVAKMGDVSVEDGIRQGLSTLTNL